MATWIQRTDEAIDDFLDKKLGVAFNIFDAISPGATRNVAVNPHESKDSFLSKTFFPRKRHNFEEKHGWGALALRFFLGENKHELFEMLDNSNSIKSGYMRQSENAEHYQENIQKWYYPWREAYRCGHGKQAGLVNIAAIFNPVNCWRAIDNTFTHNGLRLIAHARSEELRGDTDEQFFSFVGGVILCGIGSILGAPRRLAELLLSPVKPLWDCWAFNIENKQIGKSTSPLGWTIATGFSALNILLLFGVVTALAIPVVTNAANKVVETLGVKTIVNFLPDKAIVPLAKDIASFLPFSTSNLANGDLSNSVSAVAGGITATAILAGNATSSAATSALCVNAFNKPSPQKNAGVDVEEAFSEKSTVASNADLNPYPDYFAKRPMISSL